MMSLMVAVASDGLRGAGLFALAAVAGGLFVLVMWLIGGRE